MQTRRTPDKPPLMLTTIAIAWLATVMSGCDDPRATADQPATSDDTARRGPKPKAVTPFLVVKGTTSGVRGEGYTNGELRYGAPGAAKLEYTQFSISTRTAIAGIEVSGPAGAEISLGDTTVTLNASGRARLQWGLMKVLEQVGPATDPKYPKQRYWRAPVTLTVTIPSGASKTYEGSVDISSWVFDEIQTVAKGPFMMPWEQDEPVDPSPDGAYVMNKLSRGGFGTGNAGTLSDIDIIVFQQAKSSHNKKCGPYLDPKGNKVMKEIKMMDSDLIAYQRRTGKELARKHLDARKSCPSETTTHEQLRALASGPLYPGSPADEWTQTLLQPNSAN